METITSIPIEDTVRRPSLSNVHSSVKISESSLLWKRALGFIGPGFMVAVGYMDPGNWATDLAAGSKYGYTLLFVIMASNLMAILLQSLALKLGIAAERDLAQACRDRYSTSGQLCPSGSSPRSPLPPAIWRRWLDRPLRFSFSSGFRWWPE